MNVEILKQIPIKDCFALYGIKVNERGFAKCPFHKEKTGSLSIHKNRYKCFGCGASGDAINLVQQLFGLSFRDACVKLSQDFNIPTDEQTKEKNIVLKALKQAETDETDRLLFDYEQKLDRYTSLWMTSQSLSEETLPKTYAAVLHGLPIAERELSIAEIKINERKMHG